MRDLRDKIDSKKLVIRNLKLLLNVVKSKGVISDINRVREEIYKHQSALRDLCDQLAVELPYQPPRPKSLSNGCECGAHWTSFPDHHSDWCPNYRR